MSTVEVTVVVGAVVTTVVSVGLVVVAVVGAGVVEAATIGVELEVVVVVVFDVGGAVEVETTFNPGRNLRRAREYWSAWS